jgi:hypothetical protein
MKKIEEFGRDLLISIEKQFLQLAEQGHESMRGMSVSGP